MSAGSMFPPAGLDTAKTNERWFELIERLRRGHKLSKPDLSRLLCVLYSEESWKQLKCGLLPNEALEVIAGIFNFPYEILKWHKNMSYEKAEARGKPDLALFKKVDKIMKSCTEGYFKEHDFVVREYNPYSNNEV